MLAQPLRTSNLRPLPLSSGQTEQKVGVLLNTNARKVTERVVKALTHVLPREDLFLSRSPLDARRIAQTVLEQRYDTVFCGGGDGTFMGFVNEVLRQVDPKVGRYASQTAPRFGVLKLGTGNGLASLVNASSLRGDGILDDVLRARANEVPGYRRMDLLDVDGRKAQFAGLGVDGKLLNDYIWVKDNLGKGFFKRMLSGGSGYFASVALRTAPHYFTHSTFTECEVRNGKSGPAYQLAGDGSAVEEIAPGGLIFRGRLMMAAAATIPYYGFGLKMFPFAAQRRRMMHLRLGAVNVAEVLTNLPKLWNGTWQKKQKIMDFHASEVDVRFAHEMPFQVAGDAAGYRDHVSFQVAKEQVDLLDFSAPTN